MNKLCSPKEKEKLMLTTSSHYFRGEANMTQDQLAVKIGTKKSYIS